MVSGARPRLARRMVPEWFDLPEASQLPPLRCTTYERWCAPVLEFVQTPRAWPALREWARERFISKNTLINLLAWLALHELIEWRDDLQAWLPARN